MYANGQIPASTLRTVAAGTQLATPVANAFLGLVTAGRFHSIDIEPVSSYGAGYRSLEVQNVFWRAGLGDRKAAGMAGIDPALRVAIAPPGSSSHGRATAIDMRFDHHAPNAADLSLAAFYGFHRPWGKADQFHFQHDLRTAVNGWRDTDRVKIVCNWLNHQDLGVQSDAVRDGVRGPRYRTALQVAAQRDRLPMTAITGKDGPQTRAAEAHYWEQLRVKRA